MFKRMSVLRRLSSDDREAFARKWQVHGTLVSQLPLIRSYVQNHVLEEFSGDGRLIQVDGIVELRFDRPEDMATAFSSPAAVSVKADEPNFLGHGTGYALANDSHPLESPQGCKLIVALLNDTEHDAEEAALEEFRSLEGLVRVVRDDVSDVIARPEMVQGPQQVNTFFHLLFQSPAFAVDAAQVMQRRLYTLKAIMRVWTLKIR